LCEPLAFQACAILGIIPFGDTVLVSALAIGGRAGEAME